MARTKKTEAEQIDIGERRLQALELRKSGLSYRKIGARLDISHEQARQDIEAELKILAAERSDKAEELRQLELERLDKLTAALDSWVEAGSHNAVNAYLRIMERRAKLLGLDAPMKTDVTSGGDKLTGAFEVKVIDYRALVAQTEKRPVRDSDASGED